MFRFLAIAAAATAALLSCMPARAAIISYDVASLGGNYYRYDYSVTNDGSFTSDVRLFDIFFDPALYAEASLSSVSDPGIESDWSPMILGSGIGIPAAFDAYASAGGIGVGGTLSGFAVRFQWLGAELPGVQYFEIYDPDTFDLLGSGTTLALASPAPVPEPASLGLLASGLAALGAMRRRRAFEKRSIAL